jgi:DNA (cytosine-5)-methyltransferase 1
VIYGLAICAGIGGLELGVGMALGGGHRTVCYIEREAFAAAVLLARMDDQALERAPIWDDLTTFDAGRWRGCVDIVSAGFPCQPWSVAGKRKGTKDDRWIWPAIVRIIREVEPLSVFVENVPGLYRHGLREVLSDLASLGFDAEWTDIRASEVGAPHRRERVFVLAYRDGAGLAKLGSGGLFDGERASRGHDPHGCDPGVAHAHDAPWDEPRWWNGASGSGAAEPEYSGEGVGNSASSGCQALAVQWPKQTGARSSNATFPPGPRDAEG